MTLTVKCLERVGGQEKTYGKKKGGMFLYMTKGQGHKCIRKVNFPVVNKPVTIVL